MNQDISEIRALSDEEIAHVGGGTLEISIGPVTLQINGDSGCWALWAGKTLVAGGCKK